MTILISDDEKTVRDYLATALDWKGLGYELIEAESGKAVIEIMKSKAIDLAIVDITMPPMSGLDVLEWVRDNNYPCIVSLLTCHDEFDFAIKALKVGCFDYILKNTITIESFAELVTRMSLEASEEAKKTRNYKKLRIESLRNEQQEIRSRIKYWLTHTSESMENIGEYFETNLGFQKEIHNFVLLSVKVENYEMAVRRYTDNDNVQFLAVIDNILSELSEGSQIFILPGEGGDFTVFLGFDKGLLLHKIVAEICKISDTLNGNSLQIKSRVRYSLPFADMTQCQQIYNQLKNLEMLRFYLGEEQTLCVSDYVVDEEVCRTFLKEFESKFKNELQQRSMAQIEICYDAAIAEIVNRLYFILPSEFIHICESCIKEFMVQYNALDEKKEAGVTTQYADSKEYKKYIMEILYSHCVPDDTSDKKSLIKKAILLIQQNYREDIGLEWLAQKLWVNPSYLSRLFSQEIGQSMTAYISSYRIEQAKILIGSSNMKLYEVAEKTGFSSSIVFSGVFKKITGETPSEYKNRIL